MTGETNDPARELVDRLERLVGTLRRHLEGAIRVLARADARDEAAPDPAVSARDLGEAAVAARRNLVAAVRALRGYRDRLRDAADDPELPAALRALLPRLDQALSTLLRNASSTQHVLHGLATELSRAAEALDTDSNRHRGAA